MVTAAVEAAVESDLGLGGRWTSLRLAGREWLWTRPEAGRERVHPGDPFVDAGGLEECVPTVRGTPDHGCAWSRPWRGADGVAAVDCDDFQLQRRMAVTDQVRAEYRLTAAPGYRFVWAAHALLDLGVGARIELPHGLPVRVYPDATSTHVASTWPLGRSFGLLGPDDGTAIGAVVIGASEVEILDGDARLRMRVEADVDVPRSIALWRNLGGFPPEAPYRSVGVEPMLGSVFDLAEAGERDAVTVPATGTVQWQLVVTAR